MSRPWQYTRSRRTLMQGVMWLILGATVGLAALVDNRRANPRNVPLDPPVQYGFLRVRPPQGWQGAQANGQLVYREAGADVENEDEESGRTLGVGQEPGIAREPLAYLARQAGPLRALVRDEKVKATPIPMAGQTGLLVALPEGAVLVDGQPAATGWSLIACAVLPDHLGVTVRLHTPKRPGAADYAMVKAVAAGLTPVPVPAAPPEGRPGHGDEE